MNNYSRTLRFFFCLALIVGFSSAAFAQATRTWVSGVGDDVNPCSRTAPCKTFAGAISKTAEGGEIDALDPGGFGTITITKAITLEGTHGGGFASILNVSTNGVNVNISTTVANHPNDAVVILRSLYIQGSQGVGRGSGVNGINYLRGERLFVQDCHIENQGTTGIKANLTSTGSLFVSDTDLTNVNRAINLTTTSGAAVLTASHVTIQGNTDGIILIGNAFAFVTDSILSRTLGGSALQAASGSVLNASRVHLYSNTTAVNALAGSTVRVNECEIIDNSNGFAGDASSIQSGGNNKLAGNSASITPAGTPLITQ